MDEFLKAIRAHHVVLMALSSAMLVFALSPRQAEETHRKALRELVQLRDLPLARYERVVRHFVDTLFRSSQNEIASAQPEGASARVTFEVHTQPSALYLHDMGGEGFRRLGPKATVDEWIDFVVKPAPLLVFVPFVFRGWRAAEPMTQAGVLGEITRLCIDGVPGTRTPLRIHRAEFQTIDGRELNDITLKARLYVECAPAGGLQKIFPGNTRSYVTIFHDWLKQEQLVEQLSERAESSDERIWLPAVRSLRNELGGLTVREAMRDLERQLVENKRDIVVFGLPVEETLAILVAPLAALLSGFFLLAHVRQLRFLGKATASAVLQFPWIGFFAGKLARAMTHVSIAILSGGSSLLLALRTAGGSGSLLAIATVLATCTLIVGVLVSRELVMFMRSLQVPETALS